jgi:transposase
MCKLKQNLVNAIQNYDFLSCYRCERDARIKIKLQALHHLQSGKKIIEVAEIVLADERTVRSWLQRFVEFDYEGLIERPGRGRKPRLPPEQEETLKDELDLLQEKRNGGRIIAQDIVDLLADKFDCNYTVSGVYTLLDRLNIVWISGRSQHPKSSHEAIESFKAAFSDELQSIVGDFPEDKIEVWWQDESRIGQQGSLSRVWATKGTRPRVIRQKQFLSTYIFGAVCPSKDKGCALILPEANTGMIQIHLDLISGSIEEGCLGLIMMDRASWHTTEALNIPQNIRLMPLPPYSPELNPMEQVWQPLRKIKLSNTCFKTYEDIVNSCCEAWNTFCDEDGNIERLCSRDWATVK